MHPPELRERAARLRAAGLTETAIAAELGINRSTLREWRDGTDAMMVACPRCWGRARPVIMTASDYAYLFGAYLGDGHISQLARTQRLRISCDPRHPAVLEEMASALTRTFLWSKLQRVPADNGSTCVLVVYSGHMSCLFPQHGTGKKHARRIVLEPWQQRLVDTAPWSLLRGLIQTDGCVFVNRTGPSEYPSYDFCNRSADILDLFATTCATLGVEFRRYSKRIRIYRRPSVKLMRAHVGIKG
jgi:hypothetical protein